jgi:hypothetical protein
MPTADKDKDLSGASEPETPDVPAELQHDDSHGFTVIRDTAAPGTPGAPVTSTSNRGTAAEAIEWIRQEVSRL